MTEEFDSLLDDISRCFVERDFDLWTSRLLLPFSIITRIGPTAMTSEADLRRNFQYYLTAMEIMAVDMVDRTAISLENCEDGTWLGTFQTRLVSQGKLATDPYTATGLLQIQDGRFMMSSMLNGRGHFEWTGVSDA
ncbi:MAG: hypothetical protein AB3N23_19915 [Paracoccaceae bacterium]